MQVKNAGPQYALPECEVIRVHKNQSRQMGIASWLNLLEKFKFKTKEFQLSISLSNVMMFNTYIKTYKHFYKTSNTNNKNLIILHLL